MLIGYLVICLLDCWVSHFLLVISILMRLVKFLLVVFFGSGLFSLLVRLFGSLI